MRSIPLCCSEREKLVPFILIERSSRVSNILIHLMSSPPLRSASTPYLGAFNRLEQRRSVLEATVNDRLFGSRCRQIAARDITLSSSRNKTRGIPATMVGSFLVLRNESLFTASPRTKRSCSQILMILFFIARPSHASLAAPTPAHRLAIWS
jgi:hypothetical protein